ncbi:MAG: hypothetical protein QM727_08385 [Niabella sp.]
MDEVEQVQERPVPDAVTREKIESAGRMARLFGLVLLASAALGLIGYFLGGADVNLPAKEGFADSEVAVAMAGPSLVRIIISLIFGGVVFWLLNSFSRNVLLGLDKGDIASLEQGMGSLSRYFMLMVGFLILFLVLVVVTVAIVALGVATV